MANLLKMWKLPTPTTGAPTELKEKHDNEYLEGLSHFKTLNWGYWNLQANIKAVSSQNRLKEWQKLWKHTFKNSPFHWKLLKQSAELYVAENQERRKRPRDKERGEPQPLPTTPTPSPATPAAAATRFPTWLSEVHEKLKIRLPTAGSYHVLLEEAIKAATDETILWLTYMGQKKREDTRKRVNYFNTTHNLLMDLQNRCKMPADAWLLTSSSLSDILRQAHVKQEFFNTLKEWLKTCKPFLKKLHNRTVQQQREAANSARMDTEA